MTVVAAVTPAVAAPVVVAPVVVVGVPVTGVMNIDPRGRAALERATLLCGGARHLDTVPPRGEERVVVGDVPACVERLRRRVPGERAVALVTGDPLLFGLGATLVRELGAEQVVVIPAASSVQEAFARAGIPWHDARVVSAHGRPLGPAVMSVRQVATAAILCGPDAPPQAVAAGLLGAGARDCRCVVAERLGEPAERVTDATLSRVAAGRYDPLSVVIVDRGTVAPGVSTQPRNPDMAAGSPASRFGRPESDFAHARGMITRAEVRAVVLSRLRPAEADVIWDVGAGSGSIGIEAAALAPRAQVFAVERSPEHIGHLRANVARLSGQRVEVVAGEAPEALAALPDPDAVVVGGHGGRLAAILVEVAARLRPGGRVVCSFATLEGVATARQSLTAWAPEVVQVSIARGVPAGRSLRLRAEDPVFVVAAERPAAAGEAAP